MREAAPASDGTYGRGQLWLQGPEGGLPEDVDPDAGLGLPEDTFWLEGHDGQSVAVIPSKRLVVVRMGLTPSKLGYRPQLLVAAIVKLSEKVRRLRSALRQHRVHGIAAINRIEIKPCADAPRIPIQALRAKESRGDTWNFASQARSAVLNQPGQALLPAEVDDMQRAAVVDGVERCRHRAPPFRDHRQRVGDEDAVEAGPAEQGFRVEVRRIAQREPDARRQVPPADRDRRRLQHLGRDVEAVELCLRKSPRCLHQVAAGAAAKLEHGAIRRRRRGRRSAGRGRAGNICG